MLRSIQADRVVPQIFLCPYSVTETQYPPDYQGQLPLAAGLWTQGTTETSQIAAMAHN